MTGGFLSIADLIYGLTGLILKDGIIVRSYFYTLSKSIGRVTIMGQVLFAIEVTTRFAAR